MNQIKSPFWCVFKRISLRNRLILFMALITLLSVSLSNIMVMYYSRNRMLELSNELIGNTISEVAKNVNEVLVSRVYTLSNLLMRDDNVYDMLNSNFYHDNQYDGRLTKTANDYVINNALFAGEIEKRYLALFEGIKIAAFFDKEGKRLNVSYSSDLSQEAVSIINDSIRNNKKSNLVIHFSPIQRNVFSNESVLGKREKFVMLVSRSLRTDTDKYFGTVVFSISEKTIFDTYSSIKFGKTDEICIFSSDGKLISSSDEMKLDHLKVADSYVELARKRDARVGFSNENGKESMIVVTPIKGTEWFVAGKVPVSEISQNVNVLLSITFFTIIAANIISLIFISLLVGNIVKPVRRIINAMKSAEEGNLNISVDVSGQYEISDIARYFNRMIEKIRILILLKYETEKRKKEAELNVLIGQINPHFLYNTLESIVWKAQSAGQNEISEMAAALGSLYRLSVNKGSIQIMVSEELEHVKAYTDIQKFRYKERFDCDIVVGDKSLLECFTIKMLLQPIVENAIVYGVESKSARVNIIVQVERKGDSLVFSVSDNGMGMTQEEIDSLMIKINETTANEDEKHDSPAKKTKGIGLKNINDRIRLYFGDDYGLVVESRKNLGTKVIVTVPAIKDGNFKF